MVKTSLYYAVLNRNVGITISEGPPRTGLEISCFKGEPFGTNAMIFSNARAIHETLAMCGVKWSRAYTLTNAADLDISIEVLHKPEK
jgi:hypothetical protein